MKQEEDKQDRRVGYIGRKERMKDELQGSITSERTKWGAPVLFSGCIRSILSPMTEPVEEGIPN